jgi:DnaJ domain
MRDPYHCLGVSQTASAEEISKAFRRLAKQLHPDVTNDPECTALFADVNAAHEILSDAEKRRAFDRGEIDTAGARALAPRARAYRRQSISFILAAVLILAGVLAVMVHQPASQRPISAMNDGVDTANSGLAAINQPDGSVEPEPRLILQQNVSYATDDTIPLGLQISGEAGGLALEITGLPPGSTLSSGRALGQGGWRIVAANVGNAMIHPPQGFRGVLDFNAELRLADDSVIDRGSFRLEWTPVVASAAVASASDTASSGISSDNHVASAAPSEPNAIPPTAESRLDRRQIELLIGQSQKLMAEGDFGAARTLLERAAEARDARAALALGSTFDPIMLAILHARGIAPDLSLARYWYERASALGSEEANERLKLLAPAKADQVSQNAVGRVRLSRFAPGNTNKVVIE